jgi:hypothetical protein
MLRNYKLRTTPGLTEQREEMGSEHNSRWQL